MGEIVQPSLTRYVGIDPSLTNTGLVCVDATGKMIDKTNVRTVAKDEIEARLITIGCKVIAFIQTNSPSMIGIEGLAYAKQANKAHALAALHFYLRVEMYVQGIKYEVIAPTQLKKFVTGKGNSKKEVMLLASFRKWGIEFRDNNICDAYGLAMYTADMYPAPSKRKLVKRK